MASCFELDNGYLVESVNCEFIVLTAAEYDRIFTALNNSPFYISLQDAAVLSGAALTLFSIAFAFRFLFGFMNQDASRH